ncbi:MAG: alanine:cation symporter family protein, partial [Gammaproteobacteria bacterium]|nr:alanine:cation symporter family protein [Gammaproteobacteria bacterium]
TGVWMDKFDQSFVHGDMEIVAGVYNESSAEDTMQLAEHLNEFSGPENDEVDVFSGELRVENGNIVSTTPITILHSRSIAEDVQINLAGEPFTGVLNVTDGAVDSDFEFTGKSLLHSVPLTQEAFRTSILGDVGADLVAIGLLLFAFSTAIAWSYYGDRAITYLFGTKLVLPYRIIYCIVFFSAAFIDTSVVWKLAAIFIVLMAVPNLLGITLLAKEMKATLKDFGEKSE